MLLKIAMAVALGSIGVLLMQRRAEREHQALLHARVEAQLRELREQLFGR